ncbi:MAG TPA: hypothetical protein VFI47_26345 [Acidimicrobiales bacterium]|nr:hypothetical protein [Acidimicrobiales bacterium]
MAKLNMPLDEDLHRRLRIACASKGVQQQVFVTEAIRKAVEEYEAAEEKRRRR